LVVLFAACGDISPSEKWKNAKPVVSAAEIKGKWSATSIPPTSQLKSWTLAISGSVVPTVAESAVTKSGIAVAPLWEYKVEGSHLFMRQPNEMWKDYGELRLVDKSLLLNSGEGLFELR